MRLVKIELPWILGFILENVKIFIFLKNQDALIKTKCCAFWLMKFKLPDFLHNIRYKMLFILIRLVSYNMFVNNSSCDVNSISSVKE